MQGLKISSFNVYPYDMDVYVALVDGSAEDDVIEKNVKALADKFSVYAITKTDLLYRKETKDEALESLESGVIDSSGCTFSITENEHNHKGVLLILNLRYGPEDETIVHECVHIIDYMYQRFGMSGENFGEGNENYAYQLGGMFKNIKQCVEELTTKDEDDDKKEEPAI